MQRFPRTKQPGEAFPVTVGFGFESDLEAGETIDTVDAVAVVVHRGSDPSPTSILSGAAAIDGTDIVQRVTGGVDGTDYQMTFTIHTSMGNTYMGDVLLSVRRAR